MVGGLWLHWKWTSLCTAKTCLDLAALWYWKAWQIRYVPVSPVPLIFPRLSRANGYASVPVLVVLKVILRVSGRVFQLSCSRIFLRLHILVIPCPNLVANEDYAFIGDPSGVFTRVVIVRVVLPYIWIVFSGKCSSSSPDLVPSAISHRRLANALLVFSSLPFFCCYLPARI